MTPCSLANACMSNITDPSLTGLLLSFALSWIRLSETAENPSSLGQGIVVAGGATTVKIVVSMGVLIFFISVVGGVAAYFGQVLVPSIIKNDGSLFLPLLEGFIATASWSIKLLLNFLHWVPLEVAAVASVMGFLMMVTRGQGYATS